MVLTWLLRGEKVAGERGTSITRGSAVGRVPPGRVTLSGRMSDERRRGHFTIVDEIASDDALMRVGKRWDNRGVRGGSGEGPEGSLGA